MKKSRPQTLQTSLFPAFSRKEVQPLPESRQYDILFLLAVNRMHLLRPHEKVLLVQSIFGKEDLVSLLPLELETIILRKIDWTQWLPLRFWEQAVRDFEYIARYSIRFVSIFDAKYPPLLRETYRPPFGIFVRGILPDPDKPAVAVVGTRTPTALGVNCAFEISKSLSDSGFCVVSGLARGIDTSAHRGALRGQGRTLAVMPGGIDMIYPVSSKPLAAAILDSGGALVTEHPPGTSIQKYRFPERNRIIAGLARSCIVVEAPEHSGALITAEFAADEGRDIFVHKKCLGSVRNAGARKLASEGAQSIETVQDIYADWAGNFELGERAHARQYGKAKAYAADDNHEEGCI